MHRSPLDVRQLNAEEVQHAWARIHASWDFPSEDSWWFPLVETSSNSVVAIEAKPFHAALGNPWLCEVLRSRGSDRILRLPEYPDLPATEEPVSNVDFRYVNPAEYYWCARSGECEWLIYASHEASLTLAGEWLVRRVVADWPDYSRHLWGNYSWAYRPAAT